MTSYVDDNYEQSIWTVDSLCMQPFFICHIYFAFKLFLWVLEIHNCLTVEWGLWRTYSHDWFICLVQKKRSLIKIIAVFSTLFFFVRSLVGNWVWMKLTTKADVFRCSSKIMQWTGTKSTFPKWQHKLVICKMKIVGW